MILEQRILQPQVGDVTLLGPTEYNAGQKPE